MPLYTLAITTTGSAGTATGTGVIPSLPPCFVEAIKVTYAGAAPATTDVTLAGTLGMAQTILTLTNVNTTGTYYPRHALHDTTGADTGSKGLFMVEGPIQISVAQCDALAPAVTVQIRTVENQEIH